MSISNTFFGLSNGTGSTLAESYDTKTRGIIKLAAMAGKQSRIYGYLITKANKYGEGVLLCTEDAMISLPKRYVEIFRGYNEDQKRELTSGRYFISNVHEIETPNGKTFIFDIINE